MLGLDNGNRILDANDPYSPVSTASFDGDFHVYRCGKVNLVSFRHPNRSRAVDSFTGVEEAAFPFPYYYSSARYMEYGKDNIFLDRLLGNNDELLGVWIISKNGKPFLFEAVGKEVLDKSTQPWKRNYPAFEPRKTWFQSKNCKEDGTGKMVCKQVNTFWYAWKNDQILPNAYVKTVQQITETETCSEEASFF